MINQNGRDAFEIYNDGVERILQEFGSCRRFLADLKKQSEETRQQKEEMEQKHSNELEDLNSQISQTQEKIQEAVTEHQSVLLKEENQYKEKKDQLAVQQEKSLGEKDKEIGLCQERLKDLEQKINETKKVPENPLTSEEVTARTDQFRRNQEEFQNAELLYVKENQDQGRLGERNEKEEKLRQRRQEADLSAASRARKRLSSEMNQMETAEDNTFLEFTSDIQKAIRKEIERIEGHREELIREDVEALMDGTRRQNETRIAKIKENHRNNLNKKEQMKTVGRWILCFPINLLKDRFSLSKKMVDYGGIGAGIICSLLMLLNPDLLGMIIIVTMIAGLGYGCLLGIKKGRGRMGMTLSIVQGIGIMVIRILPYPLLLFAVTRSVTLWAVWLAAGLLMYALYDIYYMVRRFRPSYRQLNQKYTLERSTYYDKRLEELRAAAQKYEGFLAEETEQVKEELEMEAAKLAELTRTVDEEERQLRNAFAETIWGNIVSSFEAKLKQQLKRERNQEKERVDTLARLQNEEGAQKAKLENEKTCRIQLEKEGNKKKQELDEELNRAKKEADAQLKSRKEKIENEIHKLEEQRQKKEKKQQEAMEGFLAEREQQRQALDQKFQDELNRLTGQMREDGFKGICGFDYREAWAVMHGMLTNLICYPANLGSYQGKIKNEGGIDVLQNMLASDQGMDEESLRKIKSRGGSGSCYMPRNILWGAEACGSHELEEEIRAGLGKALKESEEFKEISGWDQDQIREYGIQELPWDTLYRLKLVNSQDRPMLIYYDLGDMDKDTAERKALCRYIMKTFVFRPLFYINNKDYFKCNILVSDYPEDYKQFEQNPLLNKCMMVTEKSLFAKTLEGLYDSGEKVWKRLKPYGSLYEKNRERCKKGVLPAKDDGYRSLIIANMDYKALSNTRLKNLLNLSCQEKGNPCGVYPYLFVDLNWMKNHKEGTDRASVEYCRELAKSFQGKCCLLEKNHGQYCFTEKDSADELYELLGTIN